MTRKQSITLCQPIDQDELQAMDENDREWVEAWRKAVNKGVFEGMMLYLSFLCPIGDRCKIKSPKNCRECFTKPNKIEKCEKSE